MVSGVQLELLGWKGMKCKHFGYELKEEERYYINSKEHNNCVLCLVEDRGPMTQEEVAQYFGLSKMRICQIEKRAIEKLNRRIARFV